MADTTSSTIMSEPIPEHTDSSISTQSTVTEDLNERSVAQVTEQLAPNAEEGSQSESSDSDDELYSWKGGMPRAPLVNSIAGQKPKNRVDTRSKDYLAKSSKKKASDSASTNSSASSNTIFAEDSNTKKSNKKNDK